MRSGCIDDVTQIDGSRFDGPWSFKNETIFIDLMDAEVAKGNRPTTTFTRCSWNFLKEQLLAKTGYSYTHDQLKNKYNSLRQVYKDFIKFLNDITGKGWDLVSGTIILDEEQWSDLIKVNKRAKKFKKSGCPHYEKLMRIYGDPTIGIHAHPLTIIPSYSEDETRIESDVPIKIEVCGNIKDENQCESSTSKRSKRKRGGLMDTTSFVDDLVDNSNRGNQSYFDGPWSFKNETMFIDLMDEEVAKGNRPTTTFTRTSWAYMKDQLHAKIGYHYTHDQLKNKYNNLRQVYRDFKKLLNDIAGKGWDPVAGTITLEEEEWSDLIKANKRAKKFKKSGCPHYEKLTSIYEDTLEPEPGIHAYPTTKFPSDSEDEIRIESDAPIGTEGCGNNKDENQCESSTSKRSKRNRGGLNDTMTSLVNALIENSKRTNDILEKRFFGASSIDVNESSSKVEYRIDEELKKCLEILNNMVDINDEAYSKILKLLLEDISWRYVFLRIPESRRRGFIKYM